MRDEILSARRIPGQDDALPPPIPHAPALEWRRPAMIWLPTALIIGIGWPYLVLRGEGGVALFAAIGATLVGLAGAAALVLASRAGAPARTRRLALTPFLSFGVAGGFALPLAFAILLAALNAIERSRAEVALKDAGLGVDMVLALWPLGIMIGLPYALFVGLSVVLLALRKPPTPQPHAETDLVPRPTARDVESLF